MSESMFKFNSYTKLIAFLERLIEVKFKPINNALKDAERRTTIKKVYFIHFAFVVFSIYLAMTHFSDVGNYLVVYFYPAFQTLRALESKNEQQCMKWLTFWAVFGYIKVFETITDLLIGFLPFYSLAKILIIMWCYVPGKNNGAEMIYERLVMPTVALMKNSSLDAIGSQAIDHLSETLKIKKKSQQQPKKSSQVEPEKALQQAVVNEAIHQLGQSLNQEQVQLNGSALLAMEPPGSPSAKSQGSLDSQESIEARSPQTPVLPAQASANAPPSVPPQVPPPMPPSSTTRK